MVPFEISTSKLFQKKVKIGHREKLFSVDQWYIWEIFYTFPNTYIFPKDSMIVLNVLAVCVMLSVFVLVSNALTNKKYKKLVNYYS